VNPGFVVVQLSSLYSMSNQTCRKWFDMSSAMLACVVFCCMQNDGRAPFYFGLPVHSSPRIAVANPIRINLMLRSDAHELFRVGDA
jgi:hypothetical protein